MTNLSTELAELIERRQMAAVVPDGGNAADCHPAFVAATAALGDYIGANWPAIIAALKAAETPLGDVAGRLAQHAEFLATLPLGIDLGQWSNIANDMLGADAIITALTRQLAERDDENKRLREALIRIDGHWTDRACMGLEEAQGHTIAEMEQMARQALGGDNAE